VCEWSGFGDVIPLTPGGRAFVSLWSAFGTALWLMFLTTLVSYMGDWIYVNLVLNAWWHIRQAKAGKKDAIDDPKQQSASDSADSAERDSCPVDSLASDSSGVSCNDMELGECEERHSDDNNGDNDGGECDDDKADAAMTKAKVKNNKEKKTKPTGWDDLVESRSVQDEVLSWYTLAILNVCALVLYFATHLLGAGVLYTLEPDLGNQGPSLTPVTFGNVFYMSLMASQTICTPFSFRVCVCECACA
jgi:hypothetical protein